MRFENPPLFLGREPGKQGQDLGVRWVVLAQRLGRLANLAFTRQKDQDIARPDTMQLVAGVGDRVIKVAFVVRGGFLLLGLQRTITHFNRIQPARHLDHRRAVKVLRKAFGVDRRRGDDQFQVTPLWQQLLEEAEQEVDVQAALVRLVDDQRVVLLQPGVALRFGEQNAVGHQLDEGVWRSPVAEANLVSHQTSQLAPQLLRDACSGGTCGDASRLRVADQTRRAAPDFETNLRDLRGFSRTRFTADDHHRVLVDQRRNFLAAQVDRQIVGKLRRRQARAARGDGGTRLPQQAVVLGRQRLTFAAKKVPEIARQGAQAALVDGQTIGERAAGGMRRSRPGRLGGHRSETTGAQQRATSHRRLRSGRSDVLNQLQIVVLCKMKDKTISHRLNFVQPTVHVNRLLAFVVPRTDIR